MHVHELLDIIDSVCGNVSRDDSKILFGNEKWTIDAVGVCWFAGLDQVKEIVSHGIDTVIVRTDILNEKEGPAIEEYLKNNNIFVYRIGRKWDLAWGGNKDALAKAIGITNPKGIPYGCVGSVDGASFKSFSSRVEQASGTHILSTFGNPGKMIYRAATINRSGVLDTKALGMAITDGADAIVVPEITDALREYAEHHDIGLIGIGYYSAENPSMKILAELLRGKLKENNVPVFFFNFKPKWFA